MALALLGAPLALADEPCESCHPTEATLAVSTGGHALEVDCVSCHRDRRPGRMGAGHRAIPTCTTHHDEGRHPPKATAGRPRRVTRDCLRCHDPHGSPNLHLVRPAIRVKGPRLAAVQFVTESGTATGGFTDPAAPGKGLCEICHRHTKFYRADGQGEPHFPEETCIACHDHGVGFQPVATDQNCALCHKDEAARFAKASLHSANFSLCSDCHAEVSPTPGPGHRSAPPCADCHTNQTHAPPGYAAFPCTQCHDPHGTDNQQLVLKEITTSQGPMRTISFDNLLGQVDGSFASASAPGTGICEVCHTTTRFYRADGSGAAGHFTFSCLPCHLHATGFNPQ